MGFTPIIKEHIFEEEKYFPECHASTLVLLDKDDEVLAAWFGGTHEKHLDVAIWVARREGGKWSEPVKAADMQDIPHWNPVLFRDDNGKVYLFYKVGKIIPEWYTMLTTSDDNGITWTEPEELVKGDIGGRGPVKNKPIKLTNGSWLGPASIELGGRWNAFVDISADNGKTWTKSNLVPIDHEKLQGKGIIQPTLWESSPGKVHMLLRSTEGHIYRSDSEDGGWTWSKAYPTELPNNNSGIDLVKMENGNLVLVYNPVKGNWAARTPIVCSISRDNGLTWEDTFVLDHNEAPIDDNDGEFSYPAIVSKGNYVYITYTWKRKTIAFWKLQVD